MEEHKRKNILRIGMATLDELEEKVKAFRTMNQTALKKRYVISREELRDEDGQVVLNKLEEIDLSRVKLLRRSLPGKHQFKTFQPDEGIVIVSNMSRPEGIAFSMDLVTQIMNLGSGAYEAFIDRVDSFAELADNLSKSLFPKLIIVGYIHPDDLNNEKLAFLKIKKIDNFIRAMEVIHHSHKPAPYFPRLKQVEITPTDPKSWARFVIECINEYTRPYFVQEL